MAFLTDCALTAHFAADLTALHTLAAHLDANLPTHHNAAPAFATPHNLAASFWDKAQYTGFFAFDAAFLIHLAAALPAEAATQGTDG